MSETHKPAAQIAAQLGRTPQVIQRICRNYNLTRGPDGYNVAEVMDAVAKAKGADLRAELPEGDPRRRKVELENELLQIKIDEANGRLIDAESIAQDWQRVGTAIKNDLLALPQSLAPRVAGKTDLAEIAATIDSAVRDALRHLADKVKEPVAVESP